MFDNILNDENRGQVGIGTLIIFIALVLVAAVAAGVLVNTAGELQSRASDTGSDAQAQVSNQIDVVAATGVASDGTAGVEEIELVVKKSPGSDPIDLSEATIQYQSGSSVATLTQAGTVSGTEFTAAGVVNATDITLDENGERVTITIDANAIESDDLAAGSSVSLQIVDQSGASTVYGVNIPDVISGSYVKV